MRRKDILEGAFKNFQQNIAKGYQATQKGGGWLAPDGVEKGIKKFFTQIDDPDKDKDKDKKAAKGGAGTADATKTAQKGKNTTQTSNAPLDVKKSVPTGAAFINGKIQWKYDDKKGIWISNRKDTMQAADGIKVYNKMPKDKRQYIIKEETMSKAIKEGLADLADMAERDHEVQMARADLYKIAKYAIKLHDMMKNVSEAEGLEGWQQAKITKAADYIGSVYHNLEYDLKFADGGEMPADALAGISEEVDAKKMDVTDIDKKGNTPAYQQMKKGNPRYNDKTTKDKVKESEKDTHCSDKCCGADVKREDCKCSPDCKHCNCNDPKVAEGKSPHAKGTKKYKKHMAAIHAEGVQDTYKLKIAERLNNKLGK